MVCLVASANACITDSRVEYFWNPIKPRFYQHLVYGAGKPRCIVPLEALKKANNQDDSLIPTIRQRFVQAAREGPEGLMNLAFFLLIVDNDLINGGDLLKEAAMRYPSAQTLCQRARFLYNMKKEYTLAWQLFEKALEADPMHVDTLGYYAGFVASVQRDYDKAETLFRRCLDISPMHANHLGGYARFLATVRSKFQEAEVYFSRSIEADPHNVVNLNNYAAFLAEVIKDYERADKYFREAVEIDPSCGFALRNLLNFLVWMRGDSQAAKELWHQGGAEALRDSLDETYHPDEISPAVREDMASEARFLEAGKQVLAEKARKACAGGICVAAAQSASNLCASCGQVVGLCVLSRHCTSTCEGPACSCKDVRWCVSCILHHYWHDTKGELKSFARCPTCRAEFCMDDIEVRAPALGIETMCDKILCSTHAATSC